MTFKNIIEIFKIKLINIKHKFSSTQKINTNPIDTNYFQDLTPSIIEDDNTYSDAIKWALDNENIKNIALTGSYGSGKSTILKSFQHRYPTESTKYKYLNISLASFSEELKKNEEGGITANKDFNQLIELSILQQIFYHVPQEEIPYSRFKRIKSLKKEHLIRHAIFWVTWVIVLVNLFKHEYIKGLKLWDRRPQFLTNNILYLFKLAEIILILFGLYLIASYFIGILFNLKLNKLNFKSGELDLSKDDSSILNQHSDEILYYFETTRFNVVIIEDLDRFEEPEIFTKLRELNLLINSSKQINNHVVFIYALKDDMFKDKSRAKFFDFIIPVIPVITSTNSGDILLDNIKKLNEAALPENKLSEQFITDISLFIDDMRMLKNICNEFVIYRSKLASINLKYDLLMAFIIYKNFYPTDFSMLHFGEGLVYNAFKNKSAIVEPEFQNINRKIKKIETDILESGETFLNDIKELRSIYIQKFLEKVPKAISFNIDGTDYSFEEIKEDIHFKKFKILSSIQYNTQYLNNYNYSLAIRSQDSSISFVQLQELINKGDDYNERERLLNLKTVDNISKYKKELEILEISKKELMRLTLKQIIDRNINLGNLYADIKNEKLLFYLIQEGYIDEDYSDYISHFYEGRFTKADKQFIFSNRYREPLEFDFKLTNIENIISTLKEEEFYREATLNFSLFDFLIGNISKYSHLYNILIYQIANKSSKSRMFIDSYVLIGNNVNIFIKTLCEKWKEFWVYIELESNYTTEKKDSYLKLIIEFTEIGIIENLNSNNTLSNYISQKANFLTVTKDIKVTKIKELIKKLGIKFTSFETPSNTSTVFDYIYENNHYVINIGMIELFINVKGNDKATANKEDLKTSNYTVIKESGCVNLIKYIDDNINDYVTNIFLNLENNTEEAEESLIELINNEKISIENKVEIIKKQKTLITNITEVDSDVWDSLIENCKVNISWDNVIAYLMAEDEINKILISYLNKEINHKELSKTSLYDRIKDNAKQIQEASKRIILCNELSDNSYRDLLKSLPYIYPNLAFEDLSNAKVAALIEQRKLKLTEKNYNLLKEHFKGQHLHLIEIDPNEYIKSIKNYELNEEDILPLLKSDRFSQEDKISIMLNTDESAILSQTQLAKEIGYILANDKYQKVSFKLLSHLVEISHWTIQMKLINLQLFSLSDEEIASLLEILGEPYSEVNKKDKRPSIDYNDLNRELAENLERKGYISSWNEKWGKIKFYHKGRKEN